MLHRTVRSPRVPVDPSRWQGFSHLLLVLLLVLTLGLSSSAVSAGPSNVPLRPETTALVLVPWDGVEGVAAARAAGLTPYAHYSGPGGEFLLAGSALKVGEVEPATAIPSRVLDRDTAGGTYYLAMMPPGVAGPDWAAYGRVLLDDGAQALLRMTPGDAERLTEAGAEIAEITLAPMVVAPAGEALAQPAALLAITPDPLIQGMINAVNSTTVYNYDAQLSGVQPVTLSDGSYTITSRYTNSGTPIQKARQFVGEHLAGLGYSVENHAWSKSGYSNVNVVGQRTGTVNPNDIYIIGAHLDDMPSSGAAPGADDNASGSVATLIAADIMSQYQWGCTLRFAFWTGEEQGLLGSSVYAARSKTNGEAVKGYLNLDMVAYNAVAPRELNLFWKSTVPASQNIADLFVDVVSAYGLDLAPFKYDAVSYTIGNQSDNKSFWDQGYPAILTIEDYYGDFTPYYHKSTDTLSTLDMGYFTTMVQAAVGTFAHMSGCLIGPAATPTPTSTSTVTPTPTPTTPPPPTFTPTATATETPVLPTSTPTATATETPVLPTSTPTATATPTATPVPGILLYVSSTTSGTAGGVSFADEDILKFNRTTGVWEMFFDGSDVGVGGTDVDAASLQPDGSILMSFDAAITLTGLGTVDDSDIVRFLPTSTGATTAGSFAWYFDGSDVGLTTDGEDIDAIGFTPDGKLVISTLDAVSVTGVSGVDEDLLVFTATALGLTTSGTWAMYFDGSDVQLNNAASEDINGVWIDAANGQIFLTTVGAFSVTGASGDGADIFVCTPGTLGATTTCTYGPGLYWDGSANGFAGEVMDALEIQQ